MTPASPIDPGLAERVSALRLVSANLAQGISSGTHASPLRGASVVFAEHRDYRPGDDTRLLDWRAYARNDRLVTKRFEQETEFNVLLVQDLSASMGYGDGAARKSRVAASLLGAFAILAQSQGDPVGLLGFSDEVISEVPSRTTASHMHALFVALAQEPQSRGSTRMEAVLGRAVEQLRRRTIVVVASDFLDLDERALAPLEIAAQRGHDVRAMQVLHRDELELPFDGAHRFQGLEGEPHVDGDAERLRKRYLEAMGEHLASVRHRIGGAGGQYRLVPTHTDLLEALHDVVHVRRAGSGRARWV